MLLVVDALMNTELSLVEWFLTLKKLAKNSNNNNDDDDIDQRAFLIKYEYKRITHEIVSNKTNHARPQEEPAPQKKNSNLR